MSKAANMINMLMLLRKNDMMQMDEIAQKLEVKPRQVRRYREDWSQCGVHIGSKRGRYGGYFIMQDNKQAELGLTEQETQALLEAKENIENETAKIAIEKVII